MTRWVKQAAAKLFGAYELYHIFCSPECDGIPIPDSYHAGFDVYEMNGPDECAASESRELRSVSTQFGPESLVVGVRNHGKLAGAAAVWYGDRYASERGFWPLQDDEAKLVNIIVEEKLRGKGVASSLIRAVELASALRGFHRLYARVWHNHHSSIRAFQKAGWHKIAFVVVCRPPGLSRSLRFQIDRRITQAEASHNSCPIDCQR